MSSDQNSRALACLLCPKKLLDSACMLVDRPETFRRVETGYDGLRVFLAGDYILVPGKFCSCYYFTEKVIKQGTIWTCKHDLALRIIIALYGVERIPISEGGREIVLKFLVP